MKAKLLPIGLFVTSLTKIVTRNYRDLVRSDHPAIAKQVNSDIITVLAKSHIGSKKQVTVTSLLSRTSVLPAPMASRNSGFGSGLSLESYGRQSRRFSSTSKPNEKSYSSFFEEAEDELEGIEEISEVAYRAFVNAGKFLSKDVLFNKDLIPDFMKYLITPAALVFLYYNREYLPESLKEFVEEHVKLLPKRDKVFIEPERFDQANMIPRYGTKELEREFDSKPSSNKPVMLTLTGPSGSGKSEMAIEYANIYAQYLTKKYPGRTRVVHILHAEKPDILAQEYEELARKLGIVIFENNHTEDEYSAQLQKRVNQFFSRNHNWLLIFDNVSDYNKLKPYIPQEGQGRVLFTAQRKLNLSNERVIDVTSSKYRFSESEAISLFERHLRRQLTKDEKQQVILLEGRLMSLPLALKKAAILVDKESKSSSSVNDALSKLAVEIQQYVPTPFSESEAISLFEHHLNLKRPLSKDEKQQVILLAGRLMNSPLVLIEKAKEAAILVVEESKSSSSVTDVLSKLADEVKQYVSIANRAYEVNLYINKKIISTLSAEARVVLILMAYSNPDYSYTISNIPFDVSNLHKEVFGTDLKDAARIDIIMSELRSLEILVGYRGDRTHRALREALLDIVQATNHDQAEFKVLKAIAPIYKRLKMSNFLSTDIVNNAPLIPHVTSFFDHVFDQRVVNQDGDKELRLDAICVLRNMGTNLISSNYRSARHYLKQACSACEKLLPLDQQQIDLSAPEAIVANLTKINSKLPDLYAGVLYQLGRIYFHTKNPKDLVQAHILINAAAEISRISRNRSEALPNFFDYDEDKGFVFKQNGLLFLKMERKKVVGGKVQLKTDAEYIDDLKAVIANYEAFRREAYSTKSDRTIVTCAAQIARAYYELAIMDESVIAKVWQPLKIISQFVLTQQTSKVTSEIGVVQGCESTKALPDYLKLARLSIEEVIRIAESDSSFRNKLPEYKNTFGKILMAQGDFVSAKKEFKDVIKQLNEEGKQSWILAEAYENMARLYVDRDVNKKYGKAQGYFSSALQIQKVLHSSDPHNLEIRRVQSWQARIANENEYRSEKDNVVSF